MVADIRSQPFNGHGSSETADYFALSGLLGLGQAELPLCCLVKPTKNVKDSYVAGIGNDDVVGDPSRRSDPLEGYLHLRTHFGQRSGFASEKVSRRHAIIHQQGFEFWIVDLGSTNGIQINGVRVTHPLKLQPDDQIQMPGASFIFRQAPDSEIPRGATPHLQMTRYEVAEPEIQIAKCWMLLTDLQGFTLLSQQMAAGELAPLVGK